MFIKNEVVQIQALDGASVGFSIADENATFPGEEFVTVGILTTSPLGQNVFWSGYWATIPGLTNPERSELLGLIQTARNALAATVEGYDPADPDLSEVNHTLVEDFPDISTTLNTRVKLLAGGNYVLEAALDDAFGSNRSRLDELFGKIRRAVLLTSTGWSEV